MYCPKCSADSVHRSRTRSRWERWRKEITGKRPYRCTVCGWRGWAREQGPQVADAQRAAERALAPEPPNLAGTVLARDTSPHNVDHAKLDRDRDTSITER